MTVDVSHDPFDESSHTSATAAEQPASDSQPLVGEWLGPPEAEQRLGISERTLYRRIASGRLRKRVLDDGRIEIWVSAPATDTDSRAPRVENSHATVTPDYETDSDRQQASERALALMDRFNAALARQVEPLVRELADTRRQLVELAEQTGRLTERTEHLVAERDELLARIAQLEQAVVDSRETVAVSQHSTSENGHRPATAVGAAVSVSQAGVEPATASTPSEIASGRPTDTAQVEPPQTTGQSKRPWWLRWLPASSVRGSRRRPTT